MSIETIISGFYASAEQAGNKLLNYKREIDSKQSAIKDMVDGIKTETEIGSENEIDKLYTAQIAQYNKSLQAWKKMVTRYIEGKQFVNKFERSLLMIVFADVNAGKSTLGNFISGYAFKDTPYGKLYSKPKLYAYDYTDKTRKCGMEAEIPDGKFAESAKQETASIQYFTLHNGLTWVDTPGIHSLTEEYEELAKDYVKFADLIMFLTPSNNPWKQDEAKEVEKLVNSGKPLLVAITKSDEKTRTIVDGKPVSVLKPKSDTNRIAQENYVRQSISALKRDNVVSQQDYISISTQLAVAGMEENNEQKFEQSNMPRFLEQIGAVISEKAMELKMQRPRSELNSVIDELIEGSDKNSFPGISDILENLNSVKLKIESGGKKIKMLKSDIIGNSRNLVSNEIYSMLSSKKNGGLDNSDEISTEIGKIINKNLSEEIARTVGEEINNLEVALANTDIAINAKFEKITQTIEYTVYEAGNHLRDPRGLIEHIQHFLFDKEFYEYSVKPKTRTKEIEFGDNFGEYADSVWNSSAAAIEKIVDVELERIKQTYFDRLITSIGKIISEISDIRIQLEKMKY